ncbi:MAG: hypothetical protein HQL53_05450 [Magnetococcales bacterium]|nr:hypothetical protein [Magnetococcales bacterium]
MTDGAGKAERMVGPQVVQWLQRAVADELYIEVHINGRTKTYFTHIVDHPPPEQEVPEGEASQEPPPHVPFSYLKEKSHLIMAPLTPDAEESEVQPGARFRFLFFDGQKGVEGSIRVLEQVGLEEGLCIKLTFPQHLKVHKMRRHHRAKVIPELDVRLLEPFGTRVIDISQGGVAFCYPSESEPLSSGAMIQVMLRAPPDLAEEERLRRLELASGLAIERPPPEEIRIKAFVRNYAPLMGDESTFCEGAVLRCGLQFQINGARKALEVGEIVGHVERQYLHTQSKKQKRPGGMEEEALPGQGGTLWGRLRNALHF